MLGLLLLCIMVLISHPCLQAYWRPTLRSLYYASMLMIYKCNYSAYCKTAKECILLKISKHWAYLISGMGRDKTIPENVRTEIVVPRVQEAEFCFMMGHLPVQTRESDPDEKVITKNYVSIIILPTQFANKCICTLAPAGSCIAL